MLFRSRPTLPIRLELIRMNDDQTRLVRTLGGTSKVEEWDGSFSEVADEMVATARWSAKATRSDSIRLCSVRGQPVETRVMEDSPGTPPSGRGVSWFGPVAVMVIVALLGSGGILFLVLRRRGIRDVGCGIVLLATAILGIGGAGLVLLFSYLWLRMAQPNVPDSAPETFSR